MNMHTCILMTEESKTRFCLPNKSCRDLMTRSEMAGPQMDWRRRARVFDPNDHSSLSPSSTTPVLACDNFPRSAARTLPGRSTRAASHGPTGDLRSGSDRIAFTSATVLRTASNSDNCDDFISAVPRADSGNFKVPIYASSDASTATLLTLPSLATFHDFIRHGEHQLSIQQAPSSLREFMFLSRTV